MLFILPGLVSGFMQLILSPGMLDELNPEKICRTECEAITVEQCSFTKLAQLKNKGPFDYVYSNFGGLNCTGDLDKVLTDLTPLIKPGGYLDTGDHFKILFVGKFADF